MSFFIWNRPRTFYFSIEKYGSCCVYCYCCCCLDRACICSSLVHSLIRLAHTLGRRTAKKKWNKIKYFAQPIIAKKAAATTFNDDNFSSYSIVSRSLPFIRVLVLLFFNEMRFYLISCTMFTEAEITAKTHLWRFHEILILCVWRWWFKWGCWDF